MFLNNHILYCGFKRFNVTVVFKHIRFKSCAKTEGKPSKDACKLRIQNLAKVLDCSVPTAQRIVVNNRSILTLHDADFARNVYFCKKYLRLSEVVELPFVLTLPPSLLQHRYFSLKELGFLNVNTFHILRFSYLLKKSPEMLKKEGILLSYEYRTNTLNEFLDASESAEINSKLQNMYDDGSTLHDIKEKMNAEFLAGKLQCSIGKAHEMLHSYPPLKVQSIINTNQLLNILLEKFDFSISKINSSLNLLSLHHEAVEEFISELPEMYGIKIEKIVKRIPNTLRRTVDSLQKIETVLKNFDISNMQFMCCPKVIMFSPSTLEDRLTFLCNSEDFAVLKSYKKFLWLAYYFKNLNSRLEALREKDIPPSISMFTVSKPNFNNYLTCCQCRTHINDICFYLTNIFDVNEKDILPRLREYPNYQNASLVNCRKVIEFLLQSGVTKKQIFNGLGIIFYEVDVVKDHFTNLKIRPECQPFNEWVPHYNLIQLLIYCIEVDFGFRGNRLNKTNTKIKDYDKIDEQLDIYLN